MTEKSTGRDDRELHLPPSIKGTSSVTVEIRIGDQQFRFTENVPIMRLGTSAQQVERILLRMVSRLGLKCAAAWASSHMDGDS